MSTLNETIQSDRKPLNWLLPSFTNGILLVDNSFQRRSVWVPKNKVRLIDTVLKGLPMPEIYLWASPADPQTGQSKYRIVDGQQRLTAVKDFIAGQYSLKSEFLDKEDQNAEYANKMFSALSDRLKQLLWEYTITTRTIPSNVSREQIVAIFLRLNETDKSLNPQELRNAEFNGEFIKNAESISDLPFWTKHGIFNKAAVRRMGDLQFVSSLLMYLRSGIETEVSQAAINRMYDTYNEVYPQRESDYDISQRVLAELDKVFDENNRLSKFFGSAVHLYPLFIIAHREINVGRQINPKVWSDKLTEFMARYQEQPKDGLVFEYRVAATEGTQKRANRELRVNKLNEWLTAGEQIPLQ